MTLAVLTHTVYGQEKKQPVTVAPPNHAILSDTINGWYLVPKEFKERYDATLLRLETLQSEVASGKTRAAKAQAELAELKEELDKLRIEIEARRVHVAGAEIYEQTETIEFELGPERRLAITCNEVHVIGWDGPKVKCELKKQVLSPDKQPVDEHLKAIKIAHQHGRAEFAGKTPREMEQEEREYLAKDGAKLTEAQRANRKKLVQQIFGDRAIFSEYAGKEIDQITVDGLGYDENKSISMQVESAGVGARYGSVRQRYGELTVYVPKSAGVVVRGAERGLTVENLVAPLIIVPEGSTDSHDQGIFEIHNLTGDLIARNFQLNSISKIQGHVTINSKREFGVEGGGTSHYDDLRDIHPPRAIPVHIDRVTGGVDLNYGRVNLELSDIQGTLNVVNEFGDTRFTATANLGTAAHRIFSQAGQIDVELSEDAWSSVPILAVTNYGGVRTNVRREEFDDFHLQGADPQDSSQRDWSGFRTVEKNEDQPFIGLFSKLERFQEAMDNSARPAGLDIISRGGNITVMKK